MKIILKEEQFIQNSAAIKITMDSNIQIMEKPDWVSWEDIKNCLMEAHSVNRAKGINMSHYQWPAEKIRDAIEPNGVMLVALDGKKIVGTAAICERQGGVAWYAKGRYAYMGFAGVLPEYNGRGIYKELIRRREKIAIDQGYTIFLFDTHEKNKKIQSIAKANGYRMVSFIRVKSKDHYNVIMTKWPKHCPFSSVYCQLRFFLSRFFAQMFRRLDPIKQ